MPTPFEHLASFNRLVHEPARLAILTALAACEKADFVFLRNLTGLTKGNLPGILNGELDEFTAALEAESDRYFRLGGAPPPPLDGARGLRIPRRPLHLRSARTLTQHERW